MADPIIEDIKQKVDIVDLISNYVTLTKSGINWKACCPFHGEKTPSFMVNRERQLFRCFGCGESGDIFAFVMKQENIDFPNALQLLADKAGVHVPDKMASARKPGSPDKGTLYKVNGRAAQFFHQVLVQHPLGKTAREYLMGRGVSDVSIAKFQIGFAPLNDQAIKASLLKDGYTPAVTRLAGNPERFRNRIMFPFRDVIGQVVGFAGRALGDQQPKYLNTAETTLFHKNRYIYGLYEAKKAIAEHKRIVLVEGQLDVVMAHQAGSVETVATSGTALTGDHLALLRRYSEVLYLCLDADSAGQKATERAIRLALPYSFDVSVVVLPEGKDPGELCAKDLDAWQVCLAKPVSAIEWLMNYYFPDQASKPNAEQRQHMFETLFPYIDLLDDSVAQSYALQRFARLLGLSQDKVIVESFEQWQKTSTTADKEAMNKAAARTQAQSSSVASAATTASAPQPAKQPLDEFARRQQALIGILLVAPEQLAQTQYRLSVNELTHPAFKKLYTLIENWYNTTTTQSSQSLISNVEAALPAGARASLQKLIFDTQTQLADLSPEQVFEEYVVVVAAIRRQQQESRIQNFATQIAQAEAANDRTLVVQLMQQLNTELKKEPHAQKNP